MDSGEWNRIIGGKVSVEQNQGVYAHIAKRYV